MRDKNRGLILEAVNINKTNRTIVYRHAVMITLAQLALPRKYSRLFVMSYGSNIDDYTGPALVDTEKIVRALPLSRLPHEVLHNMF